MDPHRAANGELMAPRAGLPLPRAAIATFGPWLAQAGLPFLLIAYLGLRGGGYDVVVRSEVGIAAWWIVLLGAAVGALPLARLSRRAWIALGILGAFALWTALGISWSESAERSVAELGRVATLIGLFALTLSVQGRDGLRRMVGGAGRRGHAGRRDRAALAVRAVLVPGAGGAAGHLRVPGPPALSTRLLERPRRVRGDRPAALGGAGYGRAIHGRPRARCGGRAGPGPDGLLHAVPRRRAGGRGRARGARRASPGAARARALRPAGPGGQRDPGRRGEPARRTRRRADDGHRRQPGRRDAGDDPRRLRRRRAS